MVTTARDMHPPGRPEASGRHRAHDFGEEEYVTQAMAAGINGFVLKTDGSAELLRGVHTAAAGVALSPTVTRLVVAGWQAAHGPARQRATALVDDLSPRQRGVLRLLVRGDSNAEIAASLHLPEGTVKAYVSALLAQLGVTNRVQAAIIGHEAGVHRSGPPGESHPPRTPVFERNPALVGRRPPAHRPAPPSPPHKGVSCPALRRALPRWDAGVGAFVAGRPAADPTLGPCE